MHFLFIYKLQVRRKFKFIMKDTLQGYNFLVIIFILSETRDFFMTENQLLIDTD